MCLTVLIQQVQILSPETPESWLSQFDQKSFPLLVLYSDSFSQSRPAKLVIANLHIVLSPVCQSRTVSAQLQYLRQTPVPLQWSKLDQPKGEIMRMLSQKQPIKLKMRQRRV